MLNHSEEADRKSGERRYLLREAAKGSVTLFVDWISGPAWLDDSPPDLPRTSLPPQAEEVAPADVLEALDRHYREFSRDNSTYHANPASQSEKNANPVSPAVSPPRGMRDRDCPS